MTTTTTAQKNVPAFELFYVEERPADRHLAAIMGKTLAENAVDRIWRKVGVAFTTQSEHLSLVIGPKGDPAQRRYLAILSSHQQQARENVDAARLPVADLFEKDSEGNIDFKHKAGVLFLNSDESYTVIVGAKDDDNKVRYQMRRTERPAPTSERRPEQTASQARPELPAQTMYRFGDELMTAAELQALGLDPADHPVVGPEKPKRTTRRKATATQATAP